MHTCEISRKNKLLSLIFILFVFLTITACDTTFKGKVIDADTKQPIEGAVVVASWHEERATPTGSTSRLKDVAEVLTDKEGEWVIKGLRGREMGNITAIFTLLTGMYITNPPHFIIFKPAYCPWDPWGISVSGIDTCREKIKPTGNVSFIKGETVELPKLTMREDRWRAESVWPSLMDKEGDKETLRKIKSFIRLKNEEKRYLGLQETYKEIQNEK